MQSFKSGEIDVYTIQDKQDIVKITLEVPK